MIVKDEAFAKLTSGGLGKLTVTSAAGTKAGDTKVAVTPALTSGNSYKYKVGDEMDVPVKGQNVKGWISRRVREVRSWLLSVTLLIVW